MFISVSNKRCEIHFLKHSLDYVGSEKGEKFVLMYIQVENISERYGGYIRCFLVSDFIFFFFFKVYTYSHLDNSAMEEHEAEI